MRDWSVSDIIGENDRRNAEIFAKFNPITGEGSIGRRVRVEIVDYPIPGQWLPEPMLRVPLVKKLRKAGSVAALLHSMGADDTEGNRNKVVQLFVRIRCRYDFAFGRRCLFS